MTGPGGRWVAVSMADGTSRQDWVPTEQPAWPDGQPGSWHVVEDQPGDGARWEWHPWVAPVIPHRQPVQQTQQRQQHQAPPAPSMYAPPATRAPAPAHNTWTEPEPTRSATDFLPRWRVLSWVILAFNALMLAWVIWGASTAGGQDGNCQYLSAETCNDSSDAGTAIGVGLLIIFWALGDVILGVVWLVTNNRGRQCPACGSGVKKGHVACRRCGHDFRAASRY